MTQGCVVACLVPGEWNAAAGGLEAVLSLGSRLARGLGVELVTLVPGPLPEGLAEAVERAGVSQIDRLDDARLDRFQPDLLVEALAGYCGQCAPRALLFGQTLDARLVAPRLAGRLGSAVVMNATDLAVDAAGGVEVTASAYGGDTRAVYELRGTAPHVIGVTTTLVAVEPPSESGANVQIREIQLELDEVVERVRVVQEARASGPRLEEAEVVVAGGRGLGAPENYALVEELAEVLGGMAAASRPIVDDGWVDPSRQVGLTGKITRPALYLAAGISGASQHMAGCSAAKNLVAINNDPDAAIFRHARYGVVGDCLEILPALTRCLSADDG
jgi:electron transfer flavoprotein alpha subunit